MLLFQENKSFGFITICIHPLMYKKPCREQLEYKWSGNWDRLVYKCTLRTSGISYNIVRYEQQVQGVDHNVKVGG